MNCFGIGQDTPTSSPTRAAGELDADASRPRCRRKNSLSNFLGSLFTPPPSPPSSTPTLLEIYSSKRRSWTHGHRPRISHPRPLSLYPSDPDSSLSHDSGPPAWAIRSMDSSARTSFLHPAAASAGKLRQIEAAQKMTKRVEEGAKKSGAAVPPYVLLELIGKGSFGKVFKSRRTKERDLVAVKIIEVDRSDYKLAPADKDIAINDFVKEISILHTLKDSQAKNINIIHEAFNFHSQLWIVSEYCPGGSISTLLRASPKPGLEEKYIIAIARELALALKYVHEAGIIHRDVKAANVLITQDGQLQLCDFGVSGILESNVAKRSTIIGSPFWMPPEMHDGDELAANGYGIEVDCWAYGCTVYELATGLPPNANIAPHRLHMFLKKAPRLEGDEHSAALKEFVSFCLEERPEDRPTAEGILKNSFVANTSKKYPTAILRQLIERFAQWESAGGQRTSLFHQFGASSSTASGPHDPDEESEWNFSTTDDFAEELLNRFGPQTPEMFSENEVDDATPKQKTQKTVKTLTPFEKAQQEQRAMRGGRQMARLFDESAEPYEYGQEEEDSVYMSDLPLRRGSASRSAARETVIDLDDARVSKDLTNTPNLDLAGVETIKASRNRLRFLDDDEEDEVYQSKLTKRLTRDWRFPGAGEMTAPAASSERPRTKDWSMAKAVAEAKYASQSADEDVPEPRTLSRHLEPPFRPMLKHSTTEPVGNFGDFLHPISALDIPNSELSFEPPDRASMVESDEIGFSTLARQHSFASSAGESALTDAGNADPFYLDDDDTYNSNYNGNTIRARRSQRTSFHVHSQSEPSAVDRTSNGHLVHTRGSSLSSETELERQQRYDFGINSAPLSRDISVKNSIDSLRQATEADDFYDHDYVPVIGGGLPQKKQAMLNGRNLAKDWVDYDTDEAASSAADVDVSDVDSAHNPYLSGSQGHANDTYYMRMTSQLTKSANRGRSFRHGRSRSRFEYLPDRTGDPILDMTSEEAVGPLPSYKRHRRVVSFPRPQPPDVVALEEDAEQDAVMDEMERLLDDYVLGLRAVGRLFGDPESNEELGNVLPYALPKNGDGVAQARGPNSSRSVSMTGQ